MSRRWFGVLVLAVSACTSSETEPDPFPTWHPMDELDARLPEGVRVFWLEDTERPMRAWCVRAKLDSEAVRAEVVVASDDDRKQTASEFASELGACVVVNAGYFARRKAVATHQGILCIAGELLQDTTDRNPALGFDEAGRPDIAWTTVRDGRVVELDHGRIEAGQEHRAPKARKGDAWEVRDAVQAKPALLFDGVPYVFEDTSTEPRTAAGVTADGELVLLVVDGRQRGSRGATYAELAALLLDLGCVEGLNLDGGGSSTLVVLGERLNRPQGRDSERAVMSAVALFAAP